MAMLEVKNLEVYYGVIQAIKGISFEVNEGEVIAVQTAPERQQHYRRLQVC
jgi:ABC-type branched-subunit amino acid transport system ATPase component